MYVLPKYGQARSTVFDAISSEGIPFLEYIPKEVVYKINISEMKITFNNGSILKLVGGETHDTSIRGTNPYMVVLSEYAYFKDGVSVYDTLSPILAANGGVVIFISTVFGKNFYWHMFNTAKELPDWFVMYRKTSELKHIPEEVLIQEKARMSPSKYAQEYENDWNQGVEGSYFGVDLVRLEQEGQVTIVPHDPMLLTYVAFDIGVKDSTCLIWFQVIGEGVAVRIIDCYRNNNLGLDHYVKIIQDKPYRYHPSGYYAPHDLMVREFGGGAITRYEKGRQLGINFTVLEQTPIMEGIDNVRMTFPRLWIDKNKCRSLIDAIENYRREWDEELQTYSNKPIHNWASDYCFTSDTLVLTRIGIRPIIDLTDEDYVLTMKGWKRCTKVFLTRKNAKLVEVTFKDGTKVKCTPDHLFLTDKGWISAKLLKKGSKIQSCLMSSYNTSKEQFTDCTRQKNTSLVPIKACTEMFGVAPSEKFPRVAIYITWMASQLTTLYTTLCVYLNKNTERFRNLMQKGLVKIVGKRQMNGTDQMREEIGIGNKQLDVELGKNGKKKIDLVVGAEKNSKQLLEAEEQVENGVTKTARLLLVESVENLKEVEDVYCIKVPTTGHFALSNGAIVKNCDALRYLCQALPKIRTGLSSEEFDRQKARAMYGARSNLPSQLIPDDRYRR